MVIDESLAKLQDVVELYFDRSVKKRNISLDSS
jgi:hypothetical protein